MTLKRFSLLLLSSLLFAIMVLLMSVYNFFYLPGIKTEILDQQQQEYSLLRSALSQSQKNLQALCFDYAVWDGLVEYVKHPSDDFVQSNMPENGFEAVNVDAVLVSDTNNNLMWDYHHNSLSSSRTAILALLKQQQSNPLSNYIFPTSAEIALQTVSNRSGYLVLDGKLIYFDNTTILPSIGKGEIVGSLTMIRLIDQATIKEISQLSLVNFSISAADSTPARRSTSTSFFSSNLIKKIAPSHSWLIQNSFNDQAVQVTLNHKKVSLPQLDWPSALLLLFILISIILLALLTLSKLIITPLIRFNQNINDSSTDHFLSKMTSNYFIDEISNVSYSFNQLLLKFNAQQNYLETLTVQDALTGITNRRGLEAFSEPLMSRWHLQKIGFSVMMIDVDNFKYFNDNNGHLQGDEALIAVATSIASTMAPFEALVARYGGEEFCVIFADNNSEQTYQIADSIRKSVERLCISNKTDNRKWITVSIGVVVIDNGIENAQIYNFNHLLQYADEQLYLAKQAGRNTVMLTQFSESDSILTQS